MIYPILALAALILVFLDVRYLDIAMLQLHSVDEYAFHGSLEVMFEGLQTGRIGKLFAFTFYNYGFGFFALNLLPTSIFLATGSFSGAILMPRLVTSAFALASGYLLHRIAKDSANKAVGLWVVSILLAMPGFWSNATWFHPDWMMTFFLLGSFWFLLRDAYRFGSDFWYAVVSFAFAVSLGKIQAITFAPLLAFYLFPPSKFRNGAAMLWRNVLLGAKAAALVIVLFFATNPYLLRPKGLRAFVEIFQGNMESNATNHGSFVHVSLLDKFQQAIVPYYLPWVGVIVLVGVALLLLARSLREGSDWLFGALAATFLLNFAYVLIAVNKAWPTYYLPIFCMGFPLLAKGATLLPRRHLHLYLWPALFFQVVLHAGDYKKVVTAHKDNQSSQQYQVQLVSRSYLDKALAGISPSSHILVSPYTGFDFVALGLKFSNVHIIHGSLTRDMLVEPVPMDYVIIRKDDVYFDPRKSGMLSRPPYLQGVKLVDSLLTGKLGYEPYGANSTVMVMKRTPKAQFGTQQ